MRRIFYPFIICGLLGVVFTARAQEKHADDFATVAPFIDDQTLAVARVDLAKLDLSALQKQIVEPQMYTDPQRTAVAAEFDKLRLIADQLRGSGGKVYLVVSLAPMPGIQSANSMGLSVPTMFAVIPGAKGAALETIDQFVKAHRDMVTGGSAPPVFVAHQQLHGVTVVAAEAVLNQLKTTTAAARPEFEQALAAGADRPVCVAVVPPPIFARAAGEMFRDPAPGGDKPLGPILTRGAQWLGVGIEPNLDKLNAIGVIQSVDAEAAKTLDETARKAIVALFVQSGFPPDKASTTAVNAVRFLQLLPEVKDNRLVLSLDGERTTMFSMLVQSAWKRSLGVSQRNLSMNNLKQLSLGMLNYEDKNKHLPDRAIRDKDGKPLLSSRVAILPEIEEEALYKEFHLDEPWDSEHNRKLIDRMPEGLKSPDTWNQHPGKTRYLVPVGEKLAFPPDRGVALKEFTDGTSRTIMIVEAAPESAVIWTKPDDIEIDQQNPARGLGTGDQLINAGFGDGHAEAISSTLKPATFWAMFTRNGGEKIEADAK